MIGNTISHYKIVEKLGEGGMGEVYLAHDMELKRDIALKFLPKQYTKDSEAKERFKREAQAAAALNHPNIITVHEIGEFEDQAYIAMEYVKGSSLREKIEDGSLSMDDVLDITIQICGGLDKAHEAGIVHRDIKPENILLNEEGRVKILDFGLAKLKGVGRLTKERSTLGTVMYMSPECVRGDEVDQRTDIWSLGVLLFEMLTGDVPFKGDYEQSVIYSILNDEAEPLTEQRGGVPIILENLVTKTLKKNPDERYQKIDEIAVDLLHVKKEFEQPNQTDISQGSHSRKKSISRKAIPFVIIIFIAFALILGLERLLNLDEKKIIGQATGKSIAVLPFAAITRTTEDENFTEGIHDDILTQLTKIGALKVIARTSVMQYKNTEKRISEIGKELGVSTILEGTVRRAGNRIRIGAQLIDVKTEEHIWAETYDREYAEIFAIQSDVAEKIAIALKAKLTPEEQRSIRQEPTENLEAYNHYLKANYYFNNYYSREKYIEAAQLYEKAIELDPGFVLAYVKLVKINTLLYNFKTWDHTPERLEKSKAALKKAIELAPDLPDVRAAKGYYLEWIEKNYRTALAEYQTALENSPNNGALLSNIGILFLRQGNAAKANEYFMKSYELDPYSHDQVYYVSWSYMLQRQWADAEKWIDMHISQFPEDANGFYRKIEICLHGYGDLDRARSVVANGQSQIKNFDNTYYPWMIELYSRNYRRALTILEADSSRPQVYAVLTGQVLDYLDEHNKARATYEYAKSLLEMLVIESPDNAFYHVWLGLAHAGLGNKADALRCGKRATELHPIHSDPFGSGEQILLEMAQINIIIGEHERAIEHIESLLSFPSPVTTWQLKLDPIYDPLRGNPQFVKLISEQLN